ncbi:YcgL domain-containing protein [Luteibacter aegosomatissinici]|uniref:YcgL domain-containing protein n=1 Tax=Luteibacter aegosomatissinici TaxID=2911539 RepID=UPI001FF7513D|nr:YcgL domain-containing protein [Luteibacter aegosomatissinici]UPG94884.1 YcgL domain-containing protein [Luteibacter aegosomatissinici]
MHCYVYASLRKPDTYVWLARREGFDVLPEPLVLLLGELRFVLEVELTPQRKLPHEDTEKVLASLGGQGWHLQAPPNETLSVCNQPNLNREIDPDASLVRA